MLNDGFASAVCLLLPSAVIVLLLVHCSAAGGLLLRRGARALNLHMARLRCGCCDCGCDPKSDPVSGGRDCVYVADVPIVRGSAAAMGMAAARVLLLSAVAKGAAAASVCNTLLLHVPALLLRLPLWGLAVFVDNRAALVEICTHSAGTKQSWSNMAQRFSRTKPELVDIGLNFAEPSPTSEVLQLCRPTLDFERTEHGQQLSTPPSLPRPGLRPSTPAKTPNAPDTRRRAKTQRGQPPTARLTI